MQGLRDLSAMVSGELVCQQAVILLLLISYLKHNLLQSSTSYHGDIRREPPSYQVKPEVSWMIHSTFQHDSQHVCISHSDFYLLSWTLSPPSLQKPYSDWPLTTNRRFELKRGGGY